MLAHSRQRVCLCSAYSNYIYMTSYFLLKVNRNNSTKNKKIHKISQQIKTQKKKRKTCLSKRYTCAAALTKSVKLSIINSALKEFNQP